MPNTIHTSANHIPLVTCIITCYKKFDYLYEAIDSVLIQTYPRIELLITDDGSENFPKAGVIAYLQTHANNNIENMIVHHHEQNVGTVRNINSMLKISNGDYFIGLDGDDVFYDENVFARIVERFESTGVDFLSCSRLQCTQRLEPISLLPTDAEKRQITKLSTARKQFESFAIFQFFNIASGSAMYYSRDNLKRMGLFDERYRNWQDGPRIAEYVRQGTMIPAAYDIVSVKYRDGGVSNDPRGNSDSFVHISADRARYIQYVLKPDLWNRHIFARRRILFWYKWDVRETTFQRICLMACYPEVSFRMVVRKITGKNIR